MHFIVNCVVSCLACGNAALLPLPPARRQTSILSDNIGNQWIVHCACSGLFNGQWCFFNTIQQLDMFLSISVNFTNALKDCFTSCQMHDAMSNTDKAKSKVSDSLDTMLLFQFSTVIVMENLT